MKNPSTGYRQDVAYIHDVGFSQFALQAAPALLELFRDAGLTRGLVVDVGCGSGLWAHELVQAGYDVLGIDQSAAMLKIARQRVPQARFRRESFLTANLPTCVAVTALGEVVNYLFDADNGPAALERFFHHVHDALRPGGVFVFDAAGPGRGGAKQRYVLRDDWAVLVDTDEDGPMLTRHITSFRRKGQTYQRSDEVHRLRLYRPADLREMLRKVGFKTRLLRAFGDFRFPRGWVGIVACKP